MKLSTSLPTLPSCDRWPSQNPSFSVKLDTTKPKIAGANPGFKALNVIKPRAVL